MKRTHGPALRRQRKSMMECTVCRGTGLVAGVFFELHCTICDGTGWLCPVTGKALPLSELVLELNRRLRDALAEISRANLAGGAQQQYNENNRLGAGGTNYTGD